MRLLILAWSLLFLCGPAPAAERDRPFIDEPEPATTEGFEDEGRGWKEAATNLPPWPNDGDLIEFSVDGSPRFRYYIDGRHISVGTDGAVRYTLVVVSRSGARNLSFEGLRCTPNGAFKIYAYGNQGRFERTEGDWIRIRERRHDKLHRDLHREILCRPLEFEPRSRRDMLHAMRARTPDAANTGFLPD